MLALTHHVIVYNAYLRSGLREKGIPFQSVNYLILGDDVVINHDAVAASYLEIMKEFGVSISLGKSVVSYKITEFAKRLQGPGVDITPIGPGAVLAALRGGGSLFPALFQSCVGNLIKDYKDIIHLCNNVPGNLTNKKSLHKYVTLVLWQFAVPTAKFELPTQFFAHAREWIDGFSDAGLLLSHVNDSIMNILMKQFRASVGNLYLNFFKFIIGIGGVNLSTAPVMRIIETLMMPFTPGF